MQVCGENAMIIKVTTENQLDTCLNVLWMIVLIL